MGWRPLLPWPSPGTFQISQFLCPRFSHPEHVGRTDSHKVALELIKTCQCSVPVGASMTHVYFPQSHVSLLNSAHTHPRGACMREEVSGLGLELGDWGTHWTNLRLWAGRKSKLG